MKKWTHIDFLRLDKYVMLTHTVLLKYLSVCYSNKKYDMILDVLDYISVSNHSGNYNYNFISNVMLGFSQFLNEIDVTILEFFEKLIQRILNVCL